VSATSPVLAVISCGLANRFGFPDPGVVDRWAAAGARVWRTDRNGSLTLIVGRSGDLSIAGH
jgi:competence protein ComEC